MKTFCSHTLVKQGMPFIDIVLRQVIPYANRCLVTISEKSTDGTLEVIKQIDKDFPNKISLDFENVQSPGDLTQERQKQLERTHEDWILFLDDDDYWPEESLEEIIELLNESDDAFAINPYQIINQRYYDHSWRYKWFTKWFRNQSGLHYEHNWPRDLIYLRDKVLYWRRNPKVKRITPKFFHLSNIKYVSFRSEEWAKEFLQKTGAGKEYPEEVKKHIWRLYEQFNKFPGH